MNWYEKIIRSGKVRNGLGIIITAAVLLELITVIQYLYTRNMLESDLDQRHAQHDRNSGARSGLKRARQSV